MVMNEWCFQTLQLWYQTALENTKDVVLYLK